MQVNSSMSSPTAPPEPQPPQPPQAAPPRRPSQAEEIIDRQLRQARRQLKGVDLADGLILLAAGGMLYLLAAALVDHWLVTGGMGFAWRLLLFVGLLAASGWFFAKRVLPVLIHRINPIFAAQVIEESRPSLKNSLVNFLFLRRQREQLTRDNLSRGVYFSLERKAATELAQVEIDTAVDRAQVIRHGYLLVAVLAVCCVYLLVSPKNPLASFGRVIWPWANIQAPTRVVIEDIEPGDVVAFQGDTVSISAEVHGLEDGESVLLYYTTADGQSVDQAMPLAMPEGDYRHGCELPPSSVGLQQDTTYYLAAGDFRSQVFAIEVETALAIPVDSIRYEYPDYTALPERTVSRAGDVRAIEGTLITVQATANQPISRAWMEMNCDPLRRLEMATVEATTSAGQFRLLMKRDDPLSGQYDSYQIRFTDSVDHKNRRPIRHRIEVIPDLSPDVRLVDPPADKIELPINGSLDLKVHAEDQDFALRRVALRAERDGRSLPIAALLEKRRPYKPHEGPFDGSYRFEPARLGLAVGDEVLYWAEALDNRESFDQKSAYWRPNHNQSETPRRRITIVAHDDSQPPAENPQDQGQNPGQQPPDADDQPSNQPNEQQPGGGDNDQMQPQDQPDDQQQQPGDQPQQPDDQQQQPGDQPQQPDDQPQQPGDQPQQPDDQPQQPGDQPQQPGEQPQQPGDEQQPGDQQGASEDQHPGQENDASDSGPQPGEPNQQGSPQDDQQQPGQGTQPGGQDRGSQPGNQAGEPKPGDSGSGDPASSGGKGQPRSEPIDGQTNPGDAMEEILRYRKEQQKNQDKSGENSRPRDGDPDQASPGGDQEAGNPDKSRGEPQKDTEKGPGTSAAEDSEAQRTPDNDQSGSPKAQSSQNPGSGKGNQSKGPGEPTEKEPTDGDGEKPDATGGDPSETKGEGGAGKSTKGDQATPSPQEANQQRDKSLGEPDQTPSDQENQGKSPSNSPKDSDSKGDTSGDRSGGGEEGGGQKSKQEGTGTAGSHTAAEQGGEASTEKGAGETGTKAGDQVQADRPTGQADPNQEKGPGSTTSDQSGGKGSPGESQDEMVDPSTGEVSDSDQAGAGRAPTSDPDKRGSRTSGNPVTGGGPGEESDQPPPPPGELLASDEANLEYARQQTELALEYLEDQLAKEQPDRELLDSLGWTRRDLEEFARRWNAMKEAAVRPDGDGNDSRRQLDEALRSLGLRPRSTELRGGSGRDPLGGMKDSRRFDPPAKWRELYEAYNRSISGSE